MKMVLRVLLELVAGASLLLGYVTLTLGRSPIEPIGINVPFGESRLHIRIDWDRISKLKTGPYRDPWSHEIWGVSTYIPYDTPNIAVWPFAAVLVAWPILFWWHRLRRLKWVAGVRGNERSGYLLLFAHMVASYVLFIVLHIFIPLLFDPAYSIRYEPEAPIAFSPLWVPIWFVRSAVEGLTGNATTKAVFEIVVAVVVYMTVFGCIWFPCFREARRSHRIHRGLCPTCGYDLRAASDRCPECGAVTTKTEPVSS